MLGTLLAIACVIIMFMVFEYDDVLLEHDRALRERDAARDELEPVKLRLSAHQVMLEDCREETSDYDAENLTLWEDLIDERNEYDECRNSVSICDDYCLCPWTLQPVPPGLEWLEDG